MSLLPNSTVFASNLQLRGAKVPESEYTELPNGLKLVKHLELFTFYFNFETALLIWPACLICDEFLGIISNALLSNGLKAESWSESERPQMTIN